ncbi:efflux RND transporter permease subunit [Waterburya agarophytonicola K14]|uniref:Efflux RND transporter permease subunit n=1 Tax=Waterburya agarophytonicola KI4 TaxID=2874699 RepID=A0A964BQL5_9CYAN|nr:efflux RND transporter permease subunit [Waterburya agarophytonicola]MCC0176552.1 efflux RND transporter permease subunit [Waterburya agarophytonicola KI4]
MFDRSRFNLSRLAIEYSSVTICFWLAIAIAGIFAFSSLKYSLFPAVNFPVVVIRAEAEATSVLEMEARVTKPLENSVADIDGLAQLFSATYSGQTVVSLLLDTNIDIKNATAEVETRLAELSLSDTEIEVIPFNLNETSAISYVVTDDNNSLEELNNLATNKIVPTIARLPGVQRVDVLGIDDRQDINSDIPTANSNTLIHFNGAKAIAFQVIKQSDANTLEVVRSVEQQVAQLKEDFPDIQLVLAETPAGYIREATKATIEALLGAVALAILVIFPFLNNFKATLITAIAIPISLLGTFIVMAAAGFNLETLTLLALALAIGIIVDDAIVEVENIMRHLEEGKSPREAALSATREIGLTASISTLTIVAVFLPIGLMGGTLGQFFRPFGLTISAAVLTSLLAARTLSPILAVYWLRVKQAKPRENQRLGFAGNSYHNLLQWALNHRKTVIGISIGSFIAGIALIPLIPQGFVPQLDRGEFKIVYTTPLPKIAKRNNSAAPSQTKESPSNFSWLKNIARSPEKILLRKTIAVAQQIEEILLTHPDIESAYTIAGIRGEPNKGQIYIKLKRDRTLTTAQVQNQIRQKLPKISQVIISVEDIPFVETGEDPSFKVSLEGEDLDQLRKSAIAFKAEIEQLRGFEDVRLDGVDEPLNKIIHLDRQRVAYINANLTPERGIGDATEQAKAIANKTLSPGIRFDLEGDSARSKKILGEFAITLALAVICMLIVLYLPFQRWLEPLTIGLSLPLSIVGAMLALLITQSDFGMISLIGLIFLLGLLDKNAILLLDYANQLRSSGMSRTQAILQTGVLRLRPIVMTTFSTILGMLPIAMGWGAGSELRQPMAVGIIGGLITSSLLSLIVVPVIYTILEDWMIGDRETPSHSE